MDLFTTRGRHLGERGFRRSTDDDRDAAATAGLTILVTTFLVGLVVARGWPTPPGWVWRVQGWRRSGRLMGELTAAIREGRIDNERAVILRTDDRS
jgi:hypothetical protein